MSFSPASKPRRDMPFVDTATGMLLPHAALTVEDMWRNSVAGHITVPCQASGTDLITLTVTLHEEGAVGYDDGRTYRAKAVNTSTGDVTAKVVTVEGGELPTLKVYKENGRAQATTGDIVAGRVYRFAYNPALDSGAGGLVVDTHGKSVETEFVNATTEYKVNNTKVVGAQSAAIANVSGGATIDAEARTAINTLLAALRTHGLIAT